MHCRRDTIARIAAAGRRGAAMLPTHAGSAAKAAAFVALAALAYMGLQWANPLGVSSPALVTQTREPYKPKKIFDQVTNDRMAWVFDSFGVDRPVTDEDVARLLMLPEGLEGFSHRQVVGMVGLTAAEVLRGDYKTNISDASRADLEEFMYGMAFNDSKHIRRQAIVALGEAGLIGTPRVQALRDLLCNDPDPDVRLFALETWERFDNTKAFKSDPHHHAGTKR
ncbi:MAG: HEAT repeat domain-containing protein [Phycisphaeraceae bacterium]|nr:HEAT repeat domain-containing protein [Phycisphaeraceae bacterium]